MKAFEGFSYHNTDAIIYYPLLSNSLFTAVEKDWLTNLLWGNLLHAAQSTVKTVNWQKALSRSLQGTLLLQNTYKILLFIAPSRLPSHFQLWKKPFCSATIINILYGKFYSEGEGWVDSSRHWNLHFVPNRPGALPLILSLCALACLLLWTQVSPLSSVVLKWDFSWCGLLIVRLGPSFGPSSL